MQSPFSNYIVSETNTSSPVAIGFELESPLIDPEHVEETTKQSAPDYFGFDFQVVEKPGIDIGNAVRLNKIYQKELWSKQFDAIAKFFSSKGFSSSVLEANDADFAITVAKWQSTVFHDKKSWDGALGPNSWNLLKTLITDVKPRPPVKPTSPAKLLSRWHRVISDTALCPAAPLGSGREAFRKMVEAIQTADKETHYIYILGWMLDIEFELIQGDDTSTLKNLLQNAAKNGVEIRALIWNHPNYQPEINNALNFINGLKGSGSSVMIKDNVTFGSKSLQFGISWIQGLVRALESKIDLLRVSKTWRDFTGQINALRNEGSHHEKILVVHGKKGLIGFCGGIDINSNRISGVDAYKSGFSRSTVQHDISCELRGQGAAKLLDRFIHRWRNYCAERAYSASRLRAEGQKFDGSADSLTNMANVRILHTYNHPRTGAKDRSIKNTIEAVIRNAERSIHIEDQYMISLEIASWLNNKLREKPDFKVTILTQDDSFSRGDIYFPKIMRKKFIDKLSEGLSQSRRMNIKIQMLDPWIPPLAFHILHSKILVADQELAIIGSANCSSRSMTHDSETAAVVFNEPGSGYDFVRELFKSIGSYFPRPNIIPYTPNDEIKDWDEHYLIELSRLPHLKNLVNIPQLIDDIKPRFIDIIDPDADNTPLQQELPDALSDHYLFNGIDSYYQDGSEPQLENLTTDFLEEPQYNEAAKAYDEIISWNNEPEVWNDQESYVNEQSDYDNYEQPDNDREYSSAFTIPADTEIAEEMEYQAAIANSSSIKTKLCEGHTCWAKEVLNRLLGGALKLDKHLDEPTKKALTDFQAKNNLPVTQKIDSVTERALLEADALNRHNGTTIQKAAIDLISAAKTKVEDWTKKAVNAYPKQILSFYRDPRTITSLVLHHMAMKRYNPKTRKYSDPDSYLTTAAHFCILQDGRIIQLYPFSQLIYHSQCTSPKSVGVEFEGNFPDIYGKWWPSNTTFKDFPTQQQFEAGRFLVCYLKTVLGIKNVLAHRQSWHNRDNDPGPDVWYNVGQWAVENLGLSDGGPAFKCDTGKPILSAWRTWGNKPRDNVKETHEDFELEPEEFYNFDNKMEEEHSFEEQWLNGLTMEESYDSENSNSESSDVAWDTGGVKEAELFTGEVDQETGFNDFETTGQILSEQETRDGLNKKLKILSLLPHKVELNGKENNLEPGIMDPGIYDGPKKYKIASKLQQCLMDVMKNKKFGDVKIALVDLTKGVSKPEFAGYNHKRQESVASIGKLVPMLAAFQLRHDLRAALKQKGSKTIDELFSAMRDDWAATQVNSNGKPTNFTLGISLKGRLVLAQGNPISLTEPQAPWLENIFEVKKFPAIDFKSTGENKETLQNLTNDYNTADKETDEAREAQQRAKNNTALNEARKKFQEAQQKFAKAKSKVDALGFWERLQISVGGDVPLSNYMTSTVVMDLGYLYMASTVIQAGLYDTNREGGMWLGSDYIRSKWIGALGGGTRSSATAGSLAAFMTLMIQKRLVSPQASDEMRVLMQKLPYTLRDSSFGTGSWYKQSLENLANEGSLQELLCKVGLTLVISAGVYKVTGVDEVAFIKRAVIDKTGKPVTDKDGNPIVLQYVVAGLRAKNGTVLQNLILELDKCILANNGLTPAQGGHS